MSQNPLFQCKNIVCQGNINVPDIIKAVDVPDTQHVALIYACPRCGTKGKAASSALIWQEKLEEYNITQRNGDELLKVFAFDLQNINNLEDLQLYWYGVPPIEGHPCRCESCVRRHFGETEH